MDKRELIRLVEKPRSISIAGMCKNAGKTTVLNFLISGLWDKFTLGLTSIGRDGEGTDVVTGTVKPRIFIKKGTLAATAGQLLKNCSASREILFSGGFSTPLGSIVIFRAASDGFVELSGPSIGSEAAKIKSLLYGFGAQKVIIDGALDRKSLASSQITKAAILSTGASYAKDIDKVVSDTAAAALLMSLKKSAAADKISDPYRPCAFDEGLNAIDCEMQEPALLLKNPAVKEIYLPGAITERTFTQIIKSCKDLKQRTVTAFDPGRIICNPDIISRFYAKGGCIKVVRPANLLAVTVNPVSAYGYTFDSAEFIGKMAAAVSVPVFDVMADE